MNIADWFLGKFGRGTAKTAPVVPTAPLKPAVEVWAATREVMGREIVNFEARRDANGNLMVYKLPPGDGGGTYEVAGVNDRHHPREAAQLRALVEGQQFADAEKLASFYVIAYTNEVADWSRVPGIEFYLRDCAFNRGPKGAARILQRALRIEDDGKVGPQTRHATAVAEKAPLRLLQELRDAREDYERHIIGRNESSPFWKGLVNRWNNALRVAKSFPMDDPPQAAA